MPTPVVGFEVSAVWSWPVWEWNPLMQFEAI